MSDAVIHLDGVTKRYGTRAVVDDVSFSVAHGEIVGFLGPNGAGKTTTIRMIAGATTPSSGTVTVSGHDMAGNHRVAARRIGYLPERPPLYDTLKVIDYLRFVARAKGADRRTARLEIDRVLESCQLTHMSMSEIYKLSKGYRQRVGLAQALLCDPHALLLDEPTVGLDPDQIQETREMIRRASVGHAVLLSTHILPEVTMLCARVAILHHGRLLAIDTPLGLARAVDHSAAVRARVQGPAEQVRSALLEVDGVNGVDVEVVDASTPDRPFCEVHCLVDERDGIEARIARVLVAAFELHQLQRKDPTLEDVFLRYVRHEHTPGAMT